MIALLVVGGILSAVGLLFSLGGSVSTGMFGLGLIGAGCFCGLTAIAIRKP